MEEQLEAVKNDSPSPSLSVAQLAEIIGGEIISCPEGADGLVESLMVGALGVGPVPVYFGVRSNKAVITRGDRADIQLGALLTSTKCLILTGGIDPNANVRQLAQEKKVPIITVKKDTPATLAEIEKSLGQVVCEPATEPAPSTEDVPTAE